MEHRRNLILHIRNSKSSFVARWEGGGEEWQDMEAEEIDSGIGCRDTSSERGKMAPLAPPQTKTKKKKKDHVDEEQVSSQLLPEVEPPNKKKKKQAAEPPVTEPEPPASAKKRKKVSKLSLKKTVKPDSSSILSQLESQSMTQFKKSLGSHSTPKYLLSELDDIAEGEKSLLCAQKPRLSKLLLTPPKSPLLFPDSQSTQSKQGSKTPKKASSDSDDSSDDCAAVPDLLQGPAAQVHGHAAVQCEARGCSQR
jgi:hypothetical protein